MTSPNDYRRFTPIIYCYPALTLEQAKAMQRAIGFVMQEPAAEADHELLVQSLGSVSEALARAEAREAHD